MNESNLFVGFIEELIFEQYSGPKSECFGRYNDNCFGAKSCNKPDLESLFRMLILFTHHLILLGKLVKLQSLFLTSWLVSLPIILAPAFITKYIYWISLIFIVFILTYTKHTLCSDDNFFKNCIETRSFFINRQYLAAIVDPRYAQGLFY